MTQKEPRYEETKDHIIGLLASRWENPLLKKNARNYFESWFAEYESRILADRAQHALREGEARFSVEFDPNDWAAMDADRRAAWINEAKHALEDIAYVYRVEVK